MPVTKIRKSLNLLIKIAIIVAAYAYLYYQLGNSSTLKQGAQLFSKLAGSAGFITGLALVFILMILNWVLEAWKWRFLLRKIEHISLFDSFKAVWAGITVSTFTPNRIGELFGRSFILRKASVWQGTFATITGGLAQLLVTLITGSFCTLVFIFIYPEFIIHLRSAQFVLLLVLLVILNALLIFLYFNIRVITPLSARLFRKRFTRMQEHVSVFASYTRSELFTVFVFSSARYAVFTMQFCILFNMFGLALPLADAVMIIAMIYFIMAAIPTVALSELGVRGSLAIAITTAYFGPAMNGSLVAGAASAAAFIWLINLVIPALTGSIFVFQFRFFRKNTT